MMLDTLQGVGYGIVGLAILVVVGIVVIVRLGDSVANCASSFTLNTTTHLCANNSNASQTATPTGTAWSNADYLQGQLGSSGLSGWVPSVIAVMIGALFLAYFMGRRR